LKASNTPFGGSKRNKSQARDELIKATKIESSGDFLTINV
jgi:hypothetical protein